jgi:ribose transport system substrate-binding protein
MSPRQTFKSGALVAFIAAAAIIFAACGSSSSDSSSSGGTDSGGEKPSIAAVSVAGSEYFATYNRGFERAAEELGLDVEVQNSPSPETSAITATINAAIATNPDYLIAPPVDSVGLREPLVAASERGITVIIYDTRVENPDFALTYVNADYPKYGKEAGEELSRLVGGKGKVLFLSPITGNQDFEELEESFGQALAPGVTELPVQFTQGENGRSNAIVRATLTREPDLTGIVASSGYGGEGAIAALREAGKVGKVKVVLLSAPKYAVTALQEADAQVVVAEALEDVAADAVEAAYDDANGKKVPAEIGAPLCTITADTIDDPKNAPCLQ